MHPLPQVNESFAAEVGDALRRRRLDLGDWGQDFLWERSLVSMNFDPSAREPIPSVLPLLGDVVFCANCVSGPRG